MKRGTQGENRHDDAVKNKWKRDTFDRVVTEHISGKCPDLSVLDDLDQSYADYIAYKMKDLRDSLDYNQFKYAKQLWKAILEYRQLEIMEG
jgi:dGTP triphosphohydrolase